MSYELPAREQIEPLARRVYQLLNAPNETSAGETQRQRMERLSAAAARFREDSATLSRMLLGPVAEQLGGKRLLIVGDGALLYIPFVALPLPAAGATAGVQNSRPLNADCEIVNLPSAATLAALRRETAGRSRAPEVAAILADPVFEKDDRRVARGKRSSVRQAQARGRPTRQPSERLDAMSRSNPAGAPLGAAGARQFRRLPYTRLEVGAITPFVPAGKLKLALDFEASRETALSPELGRYRIIHFATHGLLDSENPPFTALVLSLVDSSGRPRDGFLRLRDVYNMKLGADLVVLSACQTALGKEMKGEGLIGLTRGFMYAGAPVVVASLWEVNDRASAELMSRFYEGMLGERHLGPAAALRAAQEAMRSQKRWEGPYYWAGFVIQGDWEIREDPTVTPKRLDTRLR
jgi:CHAT domain-containing protein